MIINNTNVRGIWTYSDNLVFEKGDFVVFGDQIYICKGTGVMGIKPTENRDCYTEYPGNMVKSLEEYYRIINDNDVSDDLYISSRVLNEILQDSYFGLGDSGIIESRIESDGTLSGQISKKLSSSEHVLDDLITSPDFNNGVVLVSRKFSDIKNLVGLLSFETSEESKSDMVAYIDPLKCTGCGSCADNVCPQGAIEISGEEEIEECPVCGHKYTQDDIAAEKEWSSIPYYHGHWKCPNCGAQVGPNKKTVYSYKINTSTCDLCGKCFDVCPVDAIYLVQKNSTTTGIDSSDSVDSGNQSFSNMISKYRVSDLEYVFVRQYSYKSALTGALNRIQELVDPDQGLIFFRHAYQKGDNLTMDTTDWTSCLSRDAILIGKELNRIREKLSKEESGSSVTSGFRYRSIDVTRNNDSYFISFDSLPPKVNGIKRIVTLVLEYQGKTTSSYNTTIDLSSTEEFSGIYGKTYYINDNISFTVKSTTGGFDLDFESDQDGVLLLKDVYCREAC